MIQFTPHTFTFTFNNIGTFAYYCRAHTTAMLGRVIGNPVVTNTNDSGEGSLRQAISAVNAWSALKTIGFNISGAREPNLDLTSQAPHPNSPGHNAGYT